MKKAIFAAIAIASFTGYTNAQTETKTETAIATTTSPADDERTPIKLEDLPAAVKKSLASEAFAGWTATSAFSVSGTNPHYEINLMKGEEKMVTRLDKEGNTIK